MLLFEVLESGSNWAASSRRNSTAAGLGSPMIGQADLHLKCRVSCGRNPPPVFLSPASLSTLTTHPLFQVAGNTRTRDHAVSSELTMLVNASDNNARIRCEAANSATEIPLIKFLALKVNCKNRHTAHIYAATSLPLLIPRNPTYPHVNPAKNFGTVQFI